MPERVFRLAGDGAPALALDELASPEAMERCFRRVPLLPQPADPEHPTENGGVLQQLLLLAVEDVERAAMMPWTVSGSAAPFARSSSRRTNSSAYSGLPPARSRSVAWMSAGIAA